MCGAFVIKCGTHNMIRFDGKGSKIVSNINFVDSTVKVKKFLTVK